MTKLWNWDSRPSDLFGSSYSAAWGAAGGVVLSLGAGGFHRTKAQRLSFLHVHPWQAVGAARPLGLPAFPSSWARYTTVSLNIPSFALAPGPGPRPHHRPAAPLILHHWRFEASCICSSLERAECRTLHSDPYLRVLPALRGKLDLLASHHSLPCESGGLEQCQASWTAGLRAEDGGRLEV